MTTQVAVPDPQDLQKSEPVHVVLSPSENGFPLDFAHHPAFPFKRFSVDWSPEANAASPGAPPLHFTVWGGTVFNGGEDAISRYTYCHRAALTSFVYFPADTKGGVMVRPRYFDERRSNSCLYPALRHLTMPLAARPAAKKQWITPRLETLTILADSRHMAQNAEWHGNAIKDWHQWLDSKEPEDTCPELREIRIEQADPLEDKDRQRSVIWVRKVR